MSWRWPCWYRGERDPERAQGYFNANRPLGYNTDLAQRVFDQFEREQCAQQLVQLVQHIAEHLVVTAAGGEVVESSVTTTRSRSLATALCGRASRAAQLPPQLH